MNIDEYPRPVTESPFYEIWSCLHFGLESDLLTHEMKPFFCEKVELGIKNYVFLYRFQKSI
jgi:hypothetical protein